MKTLSQADKEEVALALLLLKDFKCQGKFDTNIILSILELAEHLDVRTEYDKILSQVPPMKIEPR